MNENENKFMTENENKFKVPEGYKLTGPFRYTHALKNLNKHEWHLTRKYENFDRKNKQTLKQFGVFVGAIQKFEDNENHFIPFTSPLKSFSDFEDAVSFLIKRENRKIRKLKN
jgi:hypothetical protein